MLILLPMSNAATEPSAMRVIGSFFRLRRDLTILIRRHVLPGSNLSLEEADLLLDLYGAAKLGWTDPVADENGYVRFAALKASLVHNSAALSRRVEDLLQQGLLERRKQHEVEPKGAKVDRKCIVLRITEEGVKRIQPVYDRYGKLCEAMLEGLAPEVRQNMLTHNELLMDKARWRVS